MLRVGSFNTKHTLICMGGYNMFLYTFSPLIFQNSFAKWVDLT